MDVAVSSPTDAEDMLTETDCVVVIDALRASATAIALLEAGARSIVPVAGDGADRFGDDTIKIGEHHGERIEGFDLGNSPTEARERADLLAGEEVVFRTTNGTRCVERVGDAGVVMMGSLLNSEALIETCRDRLSDDTRVLFVPAGRRGNPAPEDTYTAVVLARRLQAALGDAPTASAPAGHAGMIADASGDADGDATADRGVAATATAGGSDPAEHRRVTGGERGASRSAEEVFVESDTGQFLASKGWIEDVRFCAREDVFEAVPVLEDGRFVDGRPTAGTAGASATGTGRTERTGSTAVETTDDGESDDEPEPDTSHLDDVDSSCGCVGVWEHLSEQRSAGSDR